MSDSDMSLRQVIVVAVTVALCAIDGFDVLAISFAAPGISSEWGIDRAALGVVLSMELVGMAVGNVVMGRFADAWGRRPIILFCATLMATGMWMATTATSIVDLSFWRVVTGMGIGGTLSAINAVAAEFANEKRRSLCVSFMVIGYPIGAVIGGTIAAVLLRDNDWRSIFVFGAMATATLIPVVYFFVPESVAWLCEKQPANALQRINIILKRMGKDTVTSLPPPAISEKQSLTSIFSAELAPTTILVTLAYALHITTFYYILKWVPKIVVDMGFEASSAAGVLVWANLGGASGGALFGLLTQRFHLFKLTIGALLLGTAMVILFGTGFDNLYQLSLVSAAVGFFTNSGVVGLYAILAQVYPASTRATGSGFAIGMGRGGAVFAPILAGFLFAAGQGLQTVSVIMGLGSTFAAVAIWFLMRARRSKLTT
ncbi:MAG: MFS transporter [Proteobacteria bacterium]|nr:MFS transporter [Pseudomonadota bacterium]